jgi:uncharacterized protein
MHSEPWQLALDQFHAEVKQLYGARLREIILYGSRARGDAAVDSDIDLLVVLDPLQNFWQEFERIAPIASRLSLEFDVLISALPVDANKYDRDETPLFMNSRKEGVRI